MIVAADVEQLAKIAFAIADAEPARSPERRAASHLWISSTIPPARSLAAVRRAAESYGTPTTQADALKLLDKITTQENQ